MCRDSLAEYTRRARPYTLIRVHSVTFVLLLWKMLGVSTMTTSCTVWFCNFWGRYSNNVFATDSQNRSDDSSRTCYTHTCLCCDASWCWWQHVCEGITFNIWQYWTHPVQRLLLLWPDCSSWFQSVSPATETTMVPVNMLQLRLSPLFMLRI